MISCLPRLSQKNQCQIHMCEKTKQVHTGWKNEIHTHNEGLFLKKSFFSLFNEMKIIWKFLPRNSEGPFLIQMAYFGKFGSIEMSVASWSSPRLSALELTLSSTVGWGVLSLLQSSSFGEYSSPSLSSSSSSFSYTF